MLLVAVGRNVSNPPMWGTRGWDSSMRADLIDRNRRCPGSSTAAGWVSAVVVTGPTLTQVSRRRRRSVARWDLLENSRCYRSGSPKARITAGNLLTTYRTARSAFPAGLLDLTGPCRESGKIVPEWRDFATKPKCLQGQSFRRRTPVNCRSWRQTFRERCPPASRHPVLPSQQSATARSVGRAFSPANGGWLASFGLNWRWTRF